jgi:hypothetical protein
VRVFVPVQADQAKSRQPGREQHARHVVRLRRRFDTIQLKDSVPEIVYLNSHPELRTWRNKHWVHEPKAAMYCCRDYFGNHLLYIPNHHLIIFDDPTWRDTTRGASNGHLQAKGRRDWRLVPPLLGADGQLMRRGRSPRPFKGTLMPLGMAFVLLAVGVGLLLYLLHLIWAAIAHAGAERRFHELLGAKIRGTNTGAAHTRTVRDFSVMLSRSISRRQSRRRWPTNPTAAKPKRRAHWRRDWCRSW